MVDILAQFVTLLGLAAWLPAPAKYGQWLGARFALAGYIATIFLFVGNVVVGLSVSSLTWSLGGLGAVGFASAAIRVSGRMCLKELDHPVYILTLLLFVLTAIRGGLQYQPYLGDEFASWLNLTKQIYLADHYWSPLMDYHLPSYSNGWPLLIAAVSSVYPAYADAHAVPMQFFLHVGVIGFTYDMVRAECIKTAPHDRRLATVVAWAVILAMLAVEATWRLLPTDLLIEQPMMYAYAICFLVAAVGQNDGADPRRLSLYLGLVLCAGYLFKVSILAIAPALGIFFLSFLWRDNRGQALAIRNLYGGTVSFILMFAPTAAAIVCWKFASTGDQLEASLGPVADADWALLVGDYGFRVAERMVEALWEYGAIYKTPLTIGALVVFAFATASKRWAPIMLGFWIFCGATAAGLYIYYVYRAPMPASGFLESYQRFIVLPIRILHYIGILILALEAIRVLMPRVAALMPRRILHGALGGAILAGLVWQTVQIDRSIIDMADRRYQTQANIQAIYAYKSDIFLLIAEIETRNLSTPRIGILDPLGYQVAGTVGLYYSLKNERAVPYRYFRQENATGAIKESGTAYDVLWPVTIDEHSHRVLGTLIDDPACANAPTNYLLFRTNDNRYVCVAKNGAS